VKRNIVREGAGESREKCEESEVSLGFQSYISSTFNPDHPIYQRLIFFRLNSHIELAQIWNDFYYLIYLLIYTKINRLIMTILYIIYT
jgi:hypothetical protein